MARGNPNPNKATQFKKGQCANPGGRSKADREIRDLCRDMGPELISILRDIAENGSNEHKIHAVKELLNRGYGKSEHIATVRLDRFASLTMGDLEAKIAELEAKRGA